MIRAVDTAIDTVVGQVERRKQYNAVAVKILFDLLGECENYRVPVLQFTVQQHCGFPVRKSFALLCLLNDAVDEGSVFAVLPRVVKRIENLLV